MKNFFKNNWFKFLGILILLFGIGTHPYGYYQFLRWATMLIAAYSAYLTYEHKNITWTWVFIVVGILFNPIFPFYFSKELWQMFDFAGAVVFLTSIFTKFK